MAESRSPAKRARQAERRRQRNRSVRSATRTEVRKALPLIEGGALEEAEKAVRHAVSALDKAAEKGIIHPNNAARRKSRLMKRYGAAVAAAAATPEPSPAAPKARARRTKKKESGS